MKKLLATTAVAVLALSGAASAQSVLERVLNEIDNSTNLASVNGTFANIAENIGSATAVNTYDAVTKTSTTGTDLVAGATQTQYDAWVASTTVATTYDSIAGAQYYYDPATGQVVDQAAWNNMTASEQAGWTSVAAGSTLIENADGSFDTVSTANKTTELNARTADLATAAAGVNTTYTGPAAGIDGSITNVVDGITAATQTALAGAGVSAIEWNMPTMDFGNMSTTVLGAVNTGDITLGVNQAVDEAKTTSTGAYSAVVNQLGGAADTGAIVLNIASNMTGVNGSISNTMTEVNGSVGAAATTVLGAVNTGTIVSGVNAAVAGIVSTGTAQN